jgi:hypothetical protein
VLSLLQKRLAGAEALPPGKASAAASARTMLKGVKGKAEKSKPAKAEGAGGRAADGKGAKVAKSAARRRPAGAPAAAA